ncbi:uncharacterized protein LOC101173090 [Oryzias latipes]|uniref:Si:dkeyp-77h1.4 n=1 Tax=Oryzias latipes TaxID=8090 RepID=H2MCK1_ORYLA|nr:uncharacterized protein LOC101173090 [Oryzias latipes]XP_011483781.1 uncharacterized protein LOC101173090 [Oryzias latipes]XP_023820215.1 uncharacterized protein LOC101173090 [Oryzias latipes]XP_023820217.1 uncharacterized protein LOC101173090 [Oryzias latipes]
MMTLKVIALSFVIGVALSTSVKDEESKVLFHGEDFYILLPSQLLEVSFTNRSNPRAPVLLMRGGKLVSSRQDTLTLNRDHLIIQSVGEGDEGLYTLKDPNGVHRIRLTVRDCTYEQMINYGGDFPINLWEAKPTITVEFRPKAVEANQTSSPALVVLTAVGLATSSYQGRITVGERAITLNAVTGADEGSYTIMDGNGAIKKKVCLNVKAHQEFVSLPYGKKLKINLIVNSSLVQLYYRSDHGSHLLLDKGEFTNAPAELGFQDRLSLEGSIVFLDQVKTTDKGVFMIKDMQGFVVSNIHLEVKPYRLESLYVAIIALLGLLAFLLLVCLLSCLIKVKKRAKRAAALEKLAQNAGKEDEGEAFRQVVKNITKLSEESKHSQAENTEKSQSTEVDIKGLEVSSKEVGVGNLETSDSGVGFNTALPLDTDTDAADQILDSEAVSISIAPEPKPSQPSSAESKPSAPPTVEIKPSPLPETKVSPLPEIKTTSEKPEEVKLDISKKADLKPSPEPSPDPTAGLSTADPKPLPSSSPKAKPATPKATTPVPETTLAPTPEAPKPATPEPVINGTPEPGLDSKPSPDHLGTGSTIAKPKTPEVELKSSSVVPEGSKDGTVAENSPST